MDVVVKDIIKNQLDKRFYSNPGKLATKIENPFKISYFIPTSSFKQYYDRIKPSLKRLIICWSIVILNTIMTIKYFYMGIKKDKSTYYLYGDSLIYIGRPEIGHFIFGIFSFLSAFGRFMILHQVRLSICHSLDFLYLLADIDFQKRKYLLTETHYKRYILQVSFVVWIIKKLLYLLLGFASGLLIILENLEIFILNLN